MSSSPTRRYSSGCEAMDIANGSNPEEEANKGSASYYQVLKDFTIDKQHD